MSEQPNTTQAVASDKKVVETSPVAQEISVQVQNNLVELKEISFNFRTIEIKSKDEKTGEEKKVDFKRPTFKKGLPFVTKAGLMAALSAGDEKVTEMILDQVNASVTDRARGIINDALEINTNINLNDPEEFNLDLEQLSLSKIAHLPKSERGAGIPKEQWTAFVTDYIAVMQTPEAIEKFADKKARSLDLLQKHGILLAGKFNQVRSRKDVVSQMLGFLDVWIQVTKNADDHLACYEHLTSKGKAIMEAESFEEL